MIKRTDRYWNIPALLCLLAAFLITAFRIESTNWTAELEILKLVTIIGFVIGMGFGYSYFKRGLSSVLILLYSLVLIPWMLTITAEQSLSPIDKLNNLYGRIGNTLYQLFNNIGVEDPILFLVFLSIVIWITVVWGGFWMTRLGSPWLPLLISGITIFTTEFYYINDRNFYTAAFVIVSLVLLSQINIMHSFKRWKKNGVLVEFETEFNIGRSAMLSALILVILAWNVTGIVAAFSKDSPQQRKLFGLVENFRVQFAKITAPLQGPLIIQQEFFGDSVGLGTGQVLGDDVVLEVEVNSNRPQGTRYYWRARTYDRYQNQSWESTINNEIEYTVDSEDLNHPISADFAVRDFKFQTRINLGLLYTPTYPLEINRANTVLAELISDNIIDLSALILEKTIFAGESYEVRGYIPDPTIAQMRETELVYPDWVTQTYLQLPANFPERIRLLAEEITEDKDTAYDKVVSITNYLRKNIEYQEQIPEPPQNMDPIEWFLFEHKAGFCNYYASSEVLMLRSIGIPARMVFGYAQGEADQAGRTFTVTRKSSHAWPEVYFPDIGWVEFEPTGSQPVLNRLAGVSSNPQDNQDGSINPESEVSIDEGNNALPDRDLYEEFEDLEDITTSIKTPIAVILLPYALGVGFIAAIVLILIKRNREGKPFHPPIILEQLFEKNGWKTPVWLKRWSYYVRLSPIEKSFSTISWIFYFLRKPIVQGWTAAELVNEFNIYLPHLSVYSNQMLVEYQKALYSPQIPDPDLIRSLSRKMLSQSIIFQLKKIFVSEDEIEAPI
ncbi:MAG: hypothetical protein CVU39_01880 [Chloroflexi bacterium HGW-Chloroflexi-10]|nr:MAG: hypothetical protein CVU39_01880 [Chloroflexi bacterium HGW-Chloroflexi-10]